MSVQENKILTHSREAVFIIGNGFDIDVGLPTSYAKFAQSDYWPFHKPVDNPKATPSGYRHRSLHNTLQKAALNSNWFDIEQILTNYATFNGAYDPKYGVSDNDLENAKIDKETFDLLCDSLSKYLKSIQTKELNKSSVAARVLHAIIESRYFTKIFSINYTDLKLIANHLDIESDFWYTHMHGDLNSGIVLGIESQVEFMPPYRFLCKEYNMNYQTRYLNYCLQEAKEIVIFGHALGMIDYHYFQQLFSEQSRNDMKYQDAKTITIFTKDEETKRDICDQLRNMNNKRLDLLYGRNLFRILRTDGSDEAGIREFIDNINSKGDNYKLFHNMD